MKPHLRTLTLVTGLLLGGSALAAPVPPVINPDDYPLLDAKELGHIRHIVKLSRQLPGDWSGMGTSWWNVGERAAQFELGYMAAALALVQHQYTPAYRELAQPAMHALIQKMTLPDVWERWIDISRGGNRGDPEQDNLAHGWMDPIARYNVMLKGYLLQSAAMYDVLYRDGRYDKPDAFTFKFLANTWGNGPVTFRYSLPDLARIVHQEFVDGGYAGVQCEPNRIFPTCNQPPILGLLNFDQSHGTAYAADVMPKFKQEWVKRNYVDPNTKELAALIFVKQQQLIPSGGASLEAWSGAWMNAWDRDYMRTLYPAQRDRLLPGILSGAYAAGAAIEGSPGAIAFGQMAFMAAEMGDTETRKKLLDYAERNFHPVWENGAYYYPRSDDWSVDKDGNTHGVDTWSGNALIPLARLDKGDGFHRFYAQPFTPAHFLAPFIERVDSVTTNVARAVYDQSKQALVVTLTQGPVSSANVSFAVRQLDPARSWVVLRDGKKLAEIDPAGKRVTGNAQGTQLRWAEDGSLTVQSAGRPSQSFVFVAN